MHGEKLYDLLRQKRSFFEAFLSATQSLSEIPDFRHNRERIESLINERRRCIKTIDRIDGRIHRIRKEDLSLLSRVSDEMKEKIARLATAIRDVAAEAQRLNRECEATLTLWHDGVKGQMMAVRQGHPGVRADKAYRVQQPKFLNITL